MIYKKLLLFDQRRIQKGAYGGLNPPLTRDLVEIYNFQVFLGPNECWAPHPLDEFLNTPNCIWWIINIPTFWFVKRGDPTIKSSSPSPLKSPVRRAAPKYSPICLPKLNKGIKSRQLGKLFIKFLESLDFKVSQRHSLWFYLTNSVIHFCSSRHINLKNVHLLFLA